MTIIVICYVAVDGIAFVATFYKSYFSLILSQLFLRLRVSFLSTLPIPRVKTRKTAALRTGGLLFPLL